MVGSVKEIWQTSSEFDQQYLRWLLDSQVGESSPYVEKTILLALNKLQQSELGASQLLPRVPTVLFEVLKNLRDNKASSSSLAKVIAKDAVLVAALLQEINGSYYDLSSRVNSLDNAIQILGINGLRMLIARTAFRPMMQTQSGKLTKKLAPMIWEHSEKTALACQILAQQRGLDQFDAFLSGLLHNIGLIVAFRLVDLTGVTDHFPVSAEFQMAFFKQASLLSVQVGKQWEFPELVLRAIQEKYDDPNQQSELTACLRQAEQLARLQLLLKYGIITPPDAIALFEGNAGLQACFQELNRA